MLKTTKLLEEVVAETSRILAAFDQVSLHLKSPKHTLKSKLKGRKIDSFWIYFAKNYPQGMTELTKNSRIGPAALGGIDFMH